MDRVRTGEFASPKVRKWRNQVTRISSDLTDIMGSRSVIERLQRVIAENRRLQPWNYFLDRIFRWYATSTLVLVYRDVDRSKNTVGLRRLLDEIRRTPDELARVRFRKLHTGSETAALRTDDPQSLGAFMMGRALEKDYDELAAADGESLCVRAVSADIEELVTAAADVEKVRHSVYAHRSAGGPALDSISLAAIHHLVDVLDRLVNKYRKVLLYEPFIHGHTPIDQTDWPDILTFPWILAPDRDTSIPYAATPELVETMFAALRPDEQRRLRERLR